VVMNRYTEAGLVRALVEATGVPRSWVHHEPDKPFILVLYTHGTRAHKIGLVDEGSSLLAWGEDRRGKWRQVELSLGDPLFIVRLREELERWFGDLTERA